MSHTLIKPTKWHVHSTRPQISLGIRPIWSESPLCVQWVAKDTWFLHADSKDSDQTGRMPRLIRVFAGRTCHFFGFVMRRLICLRQRSEQRPKAQLRVDWYSPYTYIGVQAEKNGPVWTVRFHETLLLILSLLIILGYFITDWFYIVFKR